MFRLAVRGEVVEKIAALMTAAFGLVAALAWNGAIRAIFSEAFGDPDELVAMLVYAVLVTIIAVIITIWIAGVSEKAKSQKAE